MQNRTLWELEEDFTHVYAYTHLHAFMRLYLHLCTCTFLLQIFQQEYKHQFNDDVCVQGA